MISHGRRVTVSIIALVVKLCLHLAVIFLGTASVSVQAFETEVQVAPDSVLGEVNRLILGNNVLGFRTDIDRRAQLFNSKGGGLWDPVKKQVTPLYLEAIKKAGISILRWPGGRWSAELDWKNLVGPVERRRGHEFGLDEFMRLCEQVDAEAIITLPVGAGLESYIADLVEYLNSPADGSNRNGGDDWAMRRAANGRIEPWRVKWFEYGNETYNTDLVVGTYIERFRKVNAAVKTVVAGVQLGAVLEDSDTFYGGWSEAILRELGSEMDFAIIHPYFPRINKVAAQHYSGLEMAGAALASDAQFKSRLTLHNDMIKEFTSRPDLQLAATEYNGLFVQTKPVPMRHTVSNAIRNADAIRIMLQPESNILFANFWQLANSYWGMIREARKGSDRVILQPNYHVYMLFNRYLGDVLVDVHFDTVTQMFHGVATTAPRVGKASDGSWAPFNRTVEKKWDIRPLSGASHEMDSGVLKVLFDGKEDLNYHHARKFIQVKPNKRYRVSVLARVENFSGGKIGIAVEDARGWKQTFNQPSNLQLKGTTDWDWISVDFNTLPDVKKIKVMVRRISGDGNVSGVASFGEVRVSEYTGNLGEVPAITGTASISQDGSKLYLIILNKHLKQNANLKIIIPGFDEMVSAEILSGSEPLALNLPPAEPDTVSVRKLKTGLKGQQWQLSMPPVSMVGLHLKKSIP